MIPIEFTEIDAISGVVLEKCHIYPNKEGNKERFLMISQGNVIHTILKINLDDNNNIIDIVEQKQIKNKL